MFKSFRQERSAEIPPFWREVTYLTELDISRINRDSFQYYCFYVPQEAFTERPKRFIDSRGRSVVEGETVSIGNLTMPLNPFTPGKATWPDSIHRELQLFQEVKLLEFWLIWKVMHIAFIYCLLNHWLWYPLENSDFH